MNNYQDLKNHSTTNNVAIGENNDLFDPYTGFISGSIFKNLYKLLI